jgi:hypothetical protein
MASKFAAVNCYKTLATHVFVGMGAASFWRGAWYILDDHLFPENAALSAATSLGLGAAGMAASQGLVARAEQLAEKLKVSQSKIVKAASASTNKTRISSSPQILKGTVAVARFGALYTVAVSCVLVWRGTWVGWDVLYEYVYLSSHPENPKSTDRGHATHSGLMSHVTAVGLLLGTGLFASVLAPPAAVSVIRDLAVKTGGSNYMGPAQIVANRLFGSGSGSAAAATAAPQRTLSTASSSTSTSTTGRKTSFHNMTSGSSSSKVYRPISTSTTSTSTAAAVKQQQPRFTK